MNQPKPVANPLFLREEALREALELLFYAYRDFTAVPDDLLGQYGLGRAHRRIVYFVGRAPGMAVSELLAILRITKQSLSRVLGQLVREGFIRQKRDAQDGRRRLLYLTAKGEDLERALTERQVASVASAYREAGAEAVAGFRTVLRGIINAEDRRRFSGPDAGR